MLKQVGRRLSRFCCSDVQGHSKAAMRLHRVPREMSCGALASPPLAARGNRPTEASCALHDIFRENIPSTYHAGEEINTVQTYASRSPIQVVDAVTDTSCRRSAPKGC